MVRVRFILIAIVGLFIQACGQGFKVQYITLSSDSNLSVVSDPTGTQARMADQFVDSIGTNSHLDGTVYQNAFGSTIKPRLKELGIRHLRVSEVDPSNSQLALLKDLNQTLGIKFTLQCDPNYGGAAAAVNYANLIGLSRLDAIEGINEPDGYFQNMHGSSWSQMTTAYQLDLYQTFKNLNTTSALPIYAPSVIWAADVLSVADSFASATHNNIHPYPAGRNPETLGWGGLQNGYYYGSLNWALANFSAFEVATHPTVVTETGYYTLPGTGNGVSEGIAGKYMPRLFLYYFNLGIEHTFSYEFFDQGTDSTNSEMHYGLIRNDGTPKPAFNNLKDLISVLKDPGDSFVAGKLDFLLGGPTQDVQTVLLQKRDGTFYLAIWIGTQGYNPDTYVDQPVVSKEITLTTTRSFQSIHQFCIGADSAWRPLSATDGKLSVTVTDSVCLISLK